ncbi:DUF3006 domain-containing protein [Deinococcus sp. Arct2-2]|uniref:DUF3006 domain-containing protein n=1 Tax=Deinococcus sp. Arct2-2 TaxID=2568653 RepID=UPI001F0E3554|nr:DUF3006 domain-containing protein [Deinococcus sp. Arct2-2]
MKDEPQAPQEQNPAPTPSAAANVVVSATVWTGERWTVDGIEDTPTGRMARVELPSGRTVDILLSSLPDGVQEGDILGIQDGPDGAVAHILREETQARHLEAGAELETLNARGAALAVDVEGEITL